MSEEINNDKFKEILNASYQPQAEASSTLTKLGYSYDPDLSTMESKVFVDKTGKPNIVYRGSTRVSDFAIEDPALAFGIKTEKQKKAEQLVKDVESKYGKPVDTFGHSLGGYRAEKSGASGNIYTFNKGAGIFDIGKKISDKQTDIRTSKDIVSSLSLGQSGGKRQTISTPLTTSVLGSHSVSQLSNAPQQSVFDSVKSKATSIVNKVLKVPTIKPPTFKFR
jgi:hypothetical protein